MDKNDTRKFVDVVQSIVQSEADVDKILTAAKLDRHERPDNRLSAEQKADLIETGIFSGLGFILLAAFVLLIFVMTH